MAGKADFAGGSSGVGQGSSPGTYARGWGSGAGRYMGGAPLLGGAPDAGTPGTQLYSSPASSQLAGYAGGYTSPEGSRVGAVMTVPQAMALEAEAKRRVEKARADKMTELDRTVLWYLEPGMGGG